MEKIMKKTLLVIFLILAGIVLFYFLRPNVSHAPTIQKDEGKTKSIEEQKEPEIPTLSINSIFDDKIDIDNLDKSKIVKLIATSDLIPARGANWPAVTSGDFTYNWKKTAGFLKKGDITLINLEAPLTKGCPLQTEGFTFCGNARHIEGIIFAGLIVSRLQITILTTLAFPEETKRYRFSKIIKSVGVGLVIWIFKK